MLSSFSLGEYQQRRQYHTTTPQESRTSPKYYIYKEHEFPLNIYFNNETMARQNFGILFDAVHMAVEKFNKNFNFTFFTVNYNIRVAPNILLIQIACGSHYGCLSSFDEKRGGILAHATYPPYRKMCVDCRDVEHPRLDVVIMHELGHILGLTHSPDKNVLSVMNAYMKQGLVDLTPYDIKRVRNLFKFLK